MPKSGKRPRRAVTVCRHTRTGQAFGSGGHARLWAFSYADLAALLDTSTGAVRTLVAAGRLDPTSLESVCRAWARRLKLVA
jgi:hypothetical protein